MSDGTESGRGGPATDGPIASELVAEPGEGAVSVARRVMGGRRRRRRVEGGRPHTVLVRFSEEEYEAVVLQAAAGRIGVAHYVALRSLDGPSGGRLDVAQVQSWAREVMALRREVARVGVNLNQIARLLNGTGEVARGAEAALAAATVAMGRVTPVVAWLRGASGYDGPTGGGGGE